MNKFDKLKKFDDFLAEQLQDPNLKAEYDALEPEFSIMQAVLKARISNGLTQKQLSERTGISQADISRLESGAASPSVKTLVRVADALGMKVQINFVV